ncbi:MAG: NAD(P)H-hydrate dehydratase [Candidatus Omnitrophota bacterium]
MRIKKRKRDSHKGDYGHLLVVAGSRGMTGAAFLCCEAALLSGSGLITLALPKSLNTIMEKKLTEQMTLPLPETPDGSISNAAYKIICKFAAKCSCVAIGPGLSMNVQTQKLVRALILDIELPIIIDADGLNALVDHLDILKQRSEKGPYHTLLTPHPGEMARLISKTTKYVQNNRKSVAKWFANEYNISIVLKGHKSLISVPQKPICVNKTGNPGMATAGSGDVLTGIIASLISQGNDSYVAARVGAYVHGLAGDIAARKKGEISLRAKDLLEYLPVAFKSIYK